MQPSLVLQKIARGETVITAKAGYTDPELVELIASAGFDAVWICLEHKRMDPSMVYALIQACRLGGADALIRVKPSNYTEVLQLIEAGARGILLPRVVHPDEVRAVDSCGSGFWAPPGGGVSGDGEQAKLSCRANRGTGGGAAH